MAAHSPTTCARCGLCLHSRRWRILLRGTVYGPHVQRNRIEKYPELFQSLHINIYIQQEITQKNNPQQLSSRVFTFFLLKSLLPKRPQFFGQQQKIIVDQQRLTMLVASSHFVSELFMCSQKSGKLDQHTTSHINPLSASLMILSNSWGCHNDPKCMAISMRQHDNKLINQQHYCEIVLSDNPDNSLGCMQW